jgi:glycosyltransferase involved in cell wall biosynthesis
VPRLAVVLITRNQAWNVDRLLASVARETAALPGTEVVLVDSASTDATTELAARHPIEVLRLRCDQPLTPAAGRFVGYGRTTGDLVLFLDGDMELVRGWLAAALAALDARPDLAVVTGEIVDLPREAPAPEASPGPVAPAAHAIPYTGGVALHRRAVLDAVGQFNPYLHSDEEPELCLRIRRAGHRIERLGLPAVHHYTDPPGALATVIGRWRRRLYLGAGQAIRHNLRSGLLGSYVRERGYGLLPGVGLVAGVAAFMRSATTRSWTVFGLWTLLVSGVVAGDLARRRSPRQTAHSLLERLLILDGTVRGFLLRPLDPADYPARYDVVRPGDTAG